MKKQEIEEHTLPLDKEYQTHFQGKRILLAEDNDVNAEIAEVILQEMGFEAERAIDGIDCINRLEYASQDYYDLILMDIQMPNMDGYKATQLIRKFPNPRKAEIPIVAMSANVFDEDKALARKMGMNDYVEKPVDSKKLEQVLYTLLKG